MASKYLLDILPPGVFIVDPSGKLYLPGMETPIVSGDVNVRLGENVILDRYVFESDDPGGGDGGDGGDGGTDFPLTPDSWYTPDSVDWPLPTLPQAVNASATCVLDGKIYLYGGYLGSPDRLKDVWEFDPKANTVSVIASHTVGVQNGMMAGVGGKLYIFGGTTTGANTGSLDQAYSYDLATGVWQQLANMPFSLRASGVAVIDEDNIAIIGGIFSTGVTNGNVYVYNIPNNSWSNPASSFTGLGITRASKRGDEIIIHSEERDSIISYNPTTNQFTTVSSSGEDIIPSSVMAIIPPNNYLHIFGGNDGGLVNSHKRYNFDGTWSDLASTTPRPIYSASSVLLDGIVYILGGLEAVEGVTGNVRSNRIIAYVSESGANRPYGIGEEP